MPATELGELVGVDAYAALYKLHRRMAGPNRDGWRPCLLQCRAIATQETVAGPPDRRLGRVACPAARTSS